MGQCLSFGCKQHKNKIGILVAQLGTPDAPNKSALYTYLKQFLSDPRVIEANRLVWWFVLRLFILTKRPARSAALYQRIWTKEGSPLMSITQEQTRLLQAALDRDAASINVVFGMRYGRPSLESAIDKLIAEGCTRILLFPMYPQYAGATTASTYDVVFSHLLKRRWIPTLRVAEPYFRNQAYVRSVAHTINAAYEKLPQRPERLVLSYHGIPEAQVRNGDPYCCMCTETTEALYPHLKLKREEVIHTYQSRFGKDPWLEPYTDVTIEQLAKSGVKRIAVACPGFPADCLETLDELGNEGRHLFKEHGGEEFTLIPCLNSDPTWISAMASIVGEEIASWRSEEGKNCELFCPVRLAKGAS